MVCGLTLCVELLRFREKVEEDLSSLNEEVGCCVLDRSVPPGALWGVEVVRG